MQSLVSASSVEGVLNSPKSHDISNILLSVILQMTLLRTAQLMVDGRNSARAQKLVAVGLSAELAASLRLQNLAKIA